MKSVEKQWMEMVARSEATVNRLFNVLEQMLIEFGPRDPALVQMAKAGSVELKLVLGAARDIRTITGAAEVMYNQYDEKKEEQKMIPDKISRVLIQCFDKILRSEPVEEAMFDTDTETIKAKMLTFSKLSLEVNSELRERLMTVVKELYREIIACFVLYRIPVQVLRDQKPFSFGRFCGNVNFGVHREYVGLIGHNEPYIVPTMM
jgi:hypothetical protein